MHVSILGGGVAGLAAGYYARAHGLPFTIYEAADHFGGNAVTLKQGDFRFDSGAHRFHDRFPEVTRELLALMNGEMGRIEVPSQIYVRGRFVDFPLSPLNVFLKMPPDVILRAGWDFLRARINGRDGHENFEKLAVSRYGRTIARMFLLGYSAKLWGAPADTLAPEVAGKRLQGLNMRTFLVEALQSRAAKAAHLDGSFYYPRKSGIGAIAWRLAQACGPGAIRLQAEVSRIRHSKNRIQILDLNDGASVDVDRVVTSVPMSEFINRLDPQPPQDIQAAARRLRYRSLILAAFFLDLPFITANASIYFPDPNLPFTRIYEPNNRCIEMSPRGKTSIVAEIPCQRGDALWRMSRTEILGQAYFPLGRMGFFKDKDIIDTAVVRLNYAYPLLDTESVAASQTVRLYLGGFSNLSLTGRNGLFRYTHIHDQLKRARSVVESLLEKGTRARAAR